jgi:hypothetical protein
MAAALAVEPDTRGSNRGYTAAPRSTVIMVIAICGKPRRGRGAATTGCRE